MRISSVAFHQFAPFEDSTVEFPNERKAGQSEVHILTGQNGTGKTRLLSLLAGALGCRIELDARVSRESLAFGLVRSFANGSTLLWHSKDDCVCELTGDFSIREVSKARQQGTCSTAIPANLVTCLPDGFSHFAALAFRGTTRIADVSIAPKATVYLGSPRSHLTFEPCKDEDQIVCQSLANLVTASALELHRKRKSVDAEGRAVHLMDRLESVVSDISRRPFSFDLESQPELRLRVIWGGIAMAIGQLPDGLRAIIGWLSACVAKLNAQFPNDDDPLSAPLILLIDEPETHLHPAWQRHILPAAQILFPNAQIFVATHSPFVISSVNEGFIHIFRADEKGVVTVDPARPCSKGDSWLDAVEDVLDVKEWYDPETETLLATFRSQRDALWQGQGNYDAVVTLAREIADRSESLSNIMGRELRQMDRVLAQKRAAQ